MSNMIKIDNTRHDLIEAINNNIYGPLLCVKLYQDIGDNFFTSLLGESRRFSMLFRESMHSC